jgi:hypothetical protein
MSTINLVTADPPTMLINLDEQAPIDQGPIGCCCDCNPISLQFSGVQFNCGCVSLGSGISTIVTEGPNTYVDKFNYIGVDIPPQSGRENSSRCWWRLEAGEYNTCTLGAHFKVYSGDCSGTPTTDRSNLVNQVHVMLISGRWYLLVVAPNFAGGYALIFYGSTDDINIPIENEVTCSPDPTHWEGPIFDCLDPLFNIPSSHIYYGVAHGGTATINLASCPAYQPVNLDWFDTITITAEGTCTGIPGPCTYSDSVTTVFTRAEIDFGMCPDPSACYPPAPGTFWLYALPGGPILDPPYSDINDSFLTANRTGVTGAWGRVKLAYNSNGSTDWIIEVVDGLLHDPMGCCSIDSTGNAIPPPGYLELTAADLFGTHSFTILGLTVSITVS